MYNQVQYFTYVLMDVVRSMDHLSILKQETIVNAGYKKKRAEQLRPPSRRSKTACKSPLIAAFIDQPPGSNLPTCRA